MRQNLTLDMEIEAYSFRHNRKLKRPGVKIPFSIEQAEEFAKCQVDPEYFIRTYVKATHPDKGVIPFDPYPYQEKFIKAMIDNRFVSACMARQMGKCVFGDNIIHIRSKKTGKMYEITARDFHAWLGFLEGVKELSRRGFVDTKVLSSQKDETKTTRHASTRSKESTPVGDIVRGEDEN